MGEILPDGKVQSGWYRSCAKCGKDFAGNIQDKRKICPSCAKKKTNKEIDRKKETEQ